MTRTRIGGDNTGGAAEADRAIADHHRYPELFR